MNRLDSQNALPRIEIKVRFQNGHCGRKRLRHGENQRQSTGNREDLPRLTRVLALAHRWNRLIEDGAIANYAEVAKLMGISRARVTQIMDLLYLAPDIQKEILLCNSIEKTQLVAPDRAMRQINRIPEWKYQRKQWQELSDSLIPRKCRVNK